MNIKLYYTPGTRSLRPRWLLEELNIPYKIEPIDLFDGEGQSEHYLKINPLGAVPAIEIDGEVILESGAMCHWLADHYIEKGLAPDPKSDERRMYEQWMFSAPGTLEPPVFYSILHSKVLPAEDRIADFVPWAMQRYQATVKYVNDALLEKTYLLGKQFTAADIMVGSTLMLSPDSLEPYPVLQAYTERLKQRVGYQQAITQ